MQQFLNCLLRLHENDHWANFQKTTSAKMICFWRANLTKSFKSSRLKENLVLLQLMFYSHSSFGMNCDKDSTWKSDKAKWKQSVSDQWMNPFIWGLNRKSLFLRCLWNDSSHNKSCDKVKFLTNHKLFSSIIYSFIYLFIFKHVCLT